MFGRELIGENFPQYVKYIDIIQKHFILHRQPQHLCIQMDVHSNIEFLYLLDI